MAKSKFDLTGQQFGTAHRDRAGRRLEHEDLLALRVRLRSGVDRVANLAARRPDPLLRLSSARGGEPDDEEAGGHQTIATCLKD